MAESERLDAEYLERGDFRNPAIRPRPQDGRGGGKGMPGGQRGNKNMNPCPDGGAGFGKGGGKGKNR